MKLRNKRTGEVATLTLSSNGEDMIIMGNDMLAHTTKLSELKDYEDYDEPKGWWYIDIHGPHNVIKNDEYYQVVKEACKEIGNYFETKEEAEKAVEKLKAIKILKDNGFRLIQWEFDMTTIADGRIWFDVGVNTQWDAEQLLNHKPEVKESLDLLFGGEE